jgi:hypothetical protein
LLGGEDGARADYYEVEVLIYLEVLVSSERMLRWFEQREGESCDACTVVNGELRLTEMVVNRSTKEVLLLVQSYMEIIHLEARTRSWHPLMLIKAAINEGFNTNGHPYCAGDSYVSLRRSELHAKRVLFQEP